ncbi:MAG: hypothetical protein HY048_12230 [Acidobacteria bacterium]|nr:hypothetical protein [Acidobacteriota bacterium]
MFSRVQVSIGIAAVAALGTVNPAAAQNEAALKAAFEGRRVTVRIDMPGTSDGVDVNADAKAAIDFPRYRDDLKRYGIALHAGEAPASQAGRLRKGMLRADIEGEFGRPAQSSERPEGALTVLTLVFTSGEERIAAEFVEDVLIRYTVVAR